MVELLNIQMDLEDISNIEVNLNDELFNAMGITLEQVSDNLDKEVLNNCVCGVYEAIKKSLNENGIK